MKAFLGNREQGREMCYKPKENLGWSDCACVWVRKKISTPIYFASLCWLWRRETPGGLPAVLPRCRRPKSIPHSVIHARRLCTGSLHTPQQDKILLSRALPPLQLGYLLQPFSSLSQLSVAPLCVLPRPSSLPRYVISVSQHAQAILIFMASN